MIRSMENSDLDQVMALWLQGNLDAHPFIPRDYWESNFPMVREQIAQAEVYVCQERGTIQGFAGLAGDYIAGIFVAREHRSQGVGKRLLDHAKAAHRALSLGVYEKNHRAVSFYLREGFRASSRQVEEATGEMEYTMTWRAEE